MRWHQPYALRRVPGVGSGSQSVALRTASNKSVKPKREYIWVVAYWTCGENPANEVVTYFFNTTLPRTRFERGDSIGTVSLVPTDAGSRFEGSFGRKILIKGDEATYREPDPIRIPMRSHAQGLVHPRLRLPCDTRRESFFNSSLPDFEAARISRPCFSQSLLLIIARLHGA